MTPRVAVIGAGAAGALTALHLAREARRRATPVEVVLLDPAGHHVAGTAFGRAGDGHLLNVPVSGMSALPDQPDHFLDWLRAHDPLARPNDFAPRRTWSTYLAQTLERELAGPMTLRHRATAITAVRATDGGVRLLTVDGAPVDAEAAVIATGLPPTHSGWAPAGLTRSKRYVADPWAAGALDRVAADEVDVLLVGTGLTMVDVVVTLSRTALAGRVLHAVSRTGELPARHVATAVEPVLPDTSEWGNSLPSILAGATAHIESVRRTNGDWRPAVDGLRYRVGSLWERLDAEQRAEFLRTHAGTWNRLRHCIPPPSAALLDRMCASGLLRLGADRVAAAEPVPGGRLRVRLVGGNVLDVGWVIDCTGPPADLRDVGSPLVEDLLDPGTRPTAVLSPLGLGLETHRGRIRDASGAASPVWTLGALRRGELWESTAVPEIRRQAQALAADILGTVAAPQCKALDAV